MEFLKRPGLFLVFLEYFFDAAVQMKGYFLIIFVDIVIKFSHTASQVYPICGIQKYDISTPNKSHIILDFGVHFNILLSVHFYFDCQNLPCFIKPRTLLLNDVIF